MLLLAKLFAEGEEEEEEEEEGEGGFGADSADARRGAPAAGPLLDDGMPLSPRSQSLKGAKIRPLSEAECGQGEASTLSDAMLAAPHPGQQSPAILSSFRAGPALPPVPPASLDGNLLAPPSAHQLAVTMGGGSGATGAVTGLPHSPSLGGGMDALMMQLPLPAMPRGDSMTALLPLSHDASVMLGG
jgi:hypothetical protein